MAHAHGTQFEQLRTMPLPVGITGPQLDGLWAAGGDAAHWGEPLNPLLASRPSLATPVPEPEAYAMLIAGLVIVAAARRRVRR